MRNIVVVGLGEALFDVLPDIKKVGGAPANFAFHASQLGLESYVVSACGNDASGDELLDKLTKRGLNLMISRVDFPTGEVQVTFKSPTEPQYNIVEGSAWDNIPYTKEMEALAKKTDAVCFGSLAQRNDVSYRSIHQFINDIENKDALKIFDINLRQHFYSKKVIDKSLEMCNVLKINDDEIGVLCDLYGMERIDVFNNAEVETLARRIIEKYSLKYMIITCGSVCSYIVTPTDFNREDTPKVDVVDAVGAGDSFTATFCSAILRGKDIRTAHKLAVDVAAEVCKSEGAMPILPETLKSRLD